MRLLLDQNLSWRLVPRWEDSFPGSAHVRDFGMTAAGDEELWSFAREHGFVIVSKDGDFDDERVFRGPLPKVIHLVVGNASSSRHSAKARPCMRDRRRDHERRFP